MESVSVASCSSKDSASKKQVNNSSKSSHQVRAKRHQSGNALRNDDSLRATKGERLPQSLDERRDDYFAVSRPGWRQLPLTTTRPPHWYNNQNCPPKAYYLPSVARMHPPWYQAPHSVKWQRQGLYRPVNRPTNLSGPLHWNVTGRRAEYTRHDFSASANCARGARAANGIPIQSFPSPSKKNAGRLSHHTSRVVFPQNIVIPKEISPSASRLESEHLTKRSNSETLDQAASPPTKKSKRGTAEEGFDKLDLLCAATLDLGPLRENPTGCSCPKSRCVALYCDCFKAGRHCDPIKCSCLNCLNTTKESGPKGARSRAIQGILARNPRAFRNAGHPAANKPRSGEQGCNCLRSRCLKLYCKCFQRGVACDPLVCTCVGCLNTEEDTTGMRKLAIEMTLEKRPDAFKEKSKTKILGAGCACKNNQCIRKYCECFRTNLKCTKKCSCKDCKNL